MKAGPLNRDINKFLIIKIDQARTGITGDFIVPQKRISLFDIQSDGNGFCDADLIRVSLSDAFNYGSNKMGIGYDSLPPGGTVGCNIRFNDDAAASPHVFKRFIEQIQGILNDIF